MKRKCNLYYIYMKILNQIFDKKAAGNSDGSVLLLDLAVWLINRHAFQEKLQSQVYGNHPVHPAGADDPSPTMPELPDAQQCCLKNADE